jgi:polar amino acid transport system substrate-binding protein
LKRRIWLGALLIAALGTVVYFAFHKEAKPQRSGPLTWAADEEGGAPYVFIDPANPGRHLGFEVDISEALAHELGESLQFKHYEFDSLIPGLLRGDFDFAMDGLEMLPARRAKVRFSRPYYVYKLQLVVRAGDNRFTSLTQLQGRKDVIVGTLAGTAAAQSLDEHHINKRTYSGQTELYTELSRGNLDAIYLDAVIHNYYLAKPQFKDLRLTGEAGEKGYYGLAFRPQDEALAERFDQALERLIHNGQLRRIYEKWNMWNEDQEELAKPDLGDGSSGPAWTISRYLPLLLEGAAMTVFLTLASMLLAVVLGLPIALLRLYAAAPLRALAVVYVEFFRGIPVLLLLYFIYYGLPDLVGSVGLGFSLQLQGWQAAILGLGINYAAYEAEIYRAGLGSISPGQWEAAASLGMSSGQTFRRIIMPQALRTILPPMTNDFVALFKDTSVVSIIAVVELTKMYQVISKDSLKYLEVGLLTAALYLIMSVPLGYLSRTLEKRWAPLQ